MITQKLLAHIDTLKPKIDEWAVEAVVQNKDIIVNLVKFKQLSKGIGSFGNSLGNYSPSTEGYADRDNISTPKTPGAPFNFYWTGGTIEGLYIKGVSKSSSSFDISTTDGKKNLLESVYGEIFDLTPENNEIVNKTIIEPYISQKIEENIFLF